MTNEPKVCVFTPGVSGRGIPLGQKHHHSPGFVEGTGSRQWSKSSATSVKLRGKLTLGINTKILAKDYSPSTLTLTCLPRLTSNSSLALSAHTSLPHIGAIELLTTGPLYMLFTLNGMLFSLLS